MRPNTYILSSKKWGIQWKWSKNDKIDDGFRLFFVFIKEIFTDYVSPFLASGIHFSDKEMLKNDHKTVRNF